MIIERACVTGPCVGRFCVLCQNGPGLDCVGICMCEIHLHLHTPSSTSHARNTYYFERVMTLGTTILQRAILKVDVWDMIQLSIISYIFYQLWSSSSSDVKSYVEFQLPCYCVLIRILYAVSNIHSICIIIHIVCDLSLAWSDGMIIMHFLTYPTCLRMMSVIIDTIDKFLR